MGFSPLTSMTITFKKSLDKSTGYDYKAGDTVKNAETIFGPAQTEYFVETGYAELEKKAPVEVADKKTTTEKATK